MVAQLGAIRFQKLCGSCNGLKPGRPVCLFCLSSVWLVDRLKHSDPKLLLKRFSDLFWGYRISFTQLCSLESGQQTKATSGVTTTLKETAKTTIKT